MLELLGVIIVVILVILLVFKMRRYFEKMLKDVSYPNIYRPKYVPYEEPGCEIIDNDMSDHQYYQPLLQDVLASYSPNPSMNQQQFGQSYQYLTNYKKNIIRDHKVFNDRRNVHRAWFN
jgi:hypothetical protein